MPDTVFDKISYLKNVDKSEYLTRISHLDRSSKRKMLIEKLREQSKRVHKNTTNKVNRFFHNTSLGNE